MATIRFGSKSYQLPGSRLARMVLGVLLIIGGILGFLPVVGFWMIPLGLIVLSFDSPRVRRWRREFEVKWLRWYRERHKTKGADGENNMGPQKK